MPYKPVTSLCSCTECIYGMMLGVAQLGGPAWPASGSAGMAVCAAPWLHIKNLGRFKRPQMLSAMADASCLLCPVTAMSQPQTYQHAKHPKWHAPTFGNSSQTLFARCRRTVPLSKGQLSFDLAMQPCGSRSHAAARPAGSCKQVSSSGRVRVVQCTASAASQAKVETVELGKSGES